MSKHKPEAIAALKTDAQRQFVVNLCRTYYDEGVKDGRGEQEALVQALERIVGWDNAGCDISRSAIENARIVLAQAKGGA